MAQLTQSFTYPLVVQPHDERRFRCYHCLGLHIQLLSEDRGTWQAEWLQQIDTCKYNCVGCGCPRECSNCTNSCASDCARSHRHSADCVQNCPMAHHRHHRIHHQTSRQHSSWYTFLKVMQNTLHDLGAAIALHRPAQPDAADEVGVPPPVARQHPRFQPGAMHDALCLSALHQYRPDSFSDLWSKIKTNRDFIEVWTTYHLHTADIELRERKSYVYMFTSKNCEQRGPRQTFDATWPFQPFKEFDNRPMYKIGSGHTDRLLDQEDDRFFQAQPVVSVRVKYPWFAEQLIHAFLRRNASLGIREFQCLGVLDATNESKIGIGKHELFGADSLGEGVKWFERDARDLQILLIQVIVLVCDLVERHATEEVFA